MGEANQTYSVFLRVKRFGFPGHQLGDLTFKPSFDLAAPWPTPHFCRHTGAHFIQEEGM